jgi:valyl-tRNA synthetase
LQLVEEQTHQAIKSYRFDHMAQALYQFVWNDYCSWYLELSKLVLTSDNAGSEQQRATRRTLVRVLEALLRLLHPIIPFITDALWRDVATLAGKNGDTIMTQPYPQPDTGKIDKSALTEMLWVQTVIGGVRNIRGEMNIDPNKPVTVLLQDAGPDDEEYMLRNIDYLTRFGKFESVSMLDGQNIPESPATALVGQMKILVPLGTLIDKQAELSRLEREHVKAQTDKDRVRSKLDNPKFIEKAPPDVVAGERARAYELETALNNLQSQIERIRALP